MQELHRRRRHNVVVARSRAEAATASSSNYDKANAHSVHKAILRRRLGASSVAICLVMALPSQSHAQAPDLGTAANFAVLAGSTVTNTGPTVLLGSLGLSPGTAVTGFPPGIVLAPGGSFITDAVAVQAQIDLASGYNAAASRPTTSDLTGQNLGGLTLTPGTYNFASSAQLTGALTLNALGNPNAVFLFNIGSTLTTGSSSSVSVIGGGLGSNVYWRVGSSATLGTTTSFVGDILALTSITLNTGANITCGSALARNGAVTLDTNNISIRNLSPCAMAPLLPTTPVITTPVVVVPVVPIVPPTGVVVPPGGTVVVVPPTAVLPPGAVVVAVPPPAGASPGSVVVVLPAGAPPVVAVTLGPTNDVTAGINNAFAVAVAGNNNALPTSFPQAFVALSGLSPPRQAVALEQLAGEVSTGVAPTGIQAMNSFLSMVLNPFAGNLPSDTRSGIGPAPVVVRALGYSDERMPKKAPAYGAIDKAAMLAEYDPRRWGIWGAAYGGQSQTAGSADLGTHDRTARFYGFAAGVDYRIWPDTVVGFALGGGGTNFGLSQSLGGGRSDMFQAAVYSTTRVNAAYVSAAFAYAWHDVTTDQYLSVASADRLTAHFDANNIGGRIEGGYRFVIPGPWLQNLAVTPYGALQAQAFYTPSYSENATSVFARSYDARTATVTRTELGAWIDQSRLLDGGTILILRGRAAWAHDNVSDPRMNSAFLSLPGSEFTVSGAALPTDLLLASAGAEIRYSNGFSLAAQFDSEFADRAVKYGGVGRLRYSW